MPAPCRAASFSREISGCKLIANDYQDAIEIRTIINSKGEMMFEHPATSHGIRSYRKTAMVLAGSTLLIGSGAQAEVLSAVTEASSADTADGQVSGESIVVRGERYRINTLNSRLPDVRDAPQSISIIPREIIEQQAATTLNDVLRNVSGISMAAGEGGGGPGGDNLTLRGFGARNWQVGLIADGLANVLPDPES
jgi:outer membrane receptor for monomeric catechols